MKSRSTLSALVIVLAVSQGIAFAQKKTPAPARPPFAWPKVPTAPTNSGGILGGVGQKIAETSMSHLLNNQLPLKLDADAVYPTVNVLPGGPFMPRSLKLTRADLDRPLAPGDYSVPVLAFCTEYSVHRPGYGIAYRLGPLQGKAANAIGELLWRGTVEQNRPPQQLQAVSWAIQSGLRYAQMPKVYQAVIDEIIPDHKSELNGDFVQGLEDTYSGYAKGAHLPPLEQMLAKMGKPGELALSARRQRTALLRQNTTDQIREQTLFAGQESGVYTPVKSEEGPWTERIPGIAYMRFKINGGNLVANNVVEIRILPRNAALAVGARTPHLVHVSFGADATLEPAVASSSASPIGAPTPKQLLQNSIGCAVGQGAQCLIPVQVPSSDRTCGVDTSFSKGTVVPSPPHVPLQVASGVTGAQGGQTKESDGITITAYPPPQCSEVHFIQFIATEHIVDGVLQPGLVLTTNPDAPASDFTYDNNKCPTGWKNDSDVVRHTLTTDATNPVWGVDARASKQNPYPFYDTGQGAGFCTCKASQITPECKGRASLTMMDAPRPVASGVCSHGPSNTVADTTFTTYAVCKTGNQWKILGQVKWSRSTQTGYGTPSISGTVDPNTLNQVCNAENITCPAFNGGVSVRQILGCSNQVTTPQVCQ